MLLTVARVKRREESLLDRVTWIQRRVDGRPGTPENRFKLEFLFF